MNYPQAQGQVKQFNPAKSAPEVAYGAAGGVQSPQPTSENNHQVLNRAIERLFGLAQQTERMVRSVGAGLPPMDGPDQSNNSVQGEPSIADKIYAIHQLLYRIENNVNAIDATNG